MVWYERLRRDIPYIKEYRHFNLWYDYNNGKHHDMKRVRTIWLEHWIKRMCKHEAYSRYIGMFIVVPMWLWIFSTYKRFKPLPKPEESLYSGAQFVASIGRNQFGYETRAAKSFEHAMGVVLGKEILGHILSQDSDVFRQEELQDEDQGLAGDFSEEDVLQLWKEPNHVPHAGIVYFRPEKHYLNEKPNDFLSPYKILGEETVVKTNHGHHH